MFRQSIFILVLMIALVTLACGVTINLPITEVKTGPIVTEDISVPGFSGESDVAEVRLVFGAGELNLSPGSREALISGQARYNVNGLKPQVRAQGEDIEIRTGDLELNTTQRLEGVSI